MLVATTIIESGIDNPHTNTLIIEDSQRLGLAQLYQLKGRVGRGRIQAYAYFMQCQKISKRAAKAGFEWESVDDVWRQVASEREEFEEAVPGSKERELEFGDMRPARPDSQRAPRTRLRVPCSYQGGKQRVAAEIAEILVDETGIVDSGAEFFDLCCGSGAISVEMINKGVDPSKITMLDRGPCVRESDGRFH